ncbi:MAG: hypothetical protein WCF03_03745 [Nitrososphaeraceae archaeon]
MTHDTRDHISPQPTSEIFVPEAESLAIAEEFQPPFESPTEPIPIPQPPIPSPLPPTLCRINLKDGMDSESHNEFRNLALYHAYDPYHPY